MSKNQSISFFQGELHGLKYQMLSEDLLISYQYASVYPYQLKQSLSTEPDKSIWFQKIEKLSIDSQTY